MPARCRRHELYTRVRPLFTVAVRLGLPCLPMATLAAAYKAGVAPAPGAPLPLLAWRALLASRTFVLLVTSYSRCARLLPQVRWGTLRWAARLPPWQVTSHARLAQGVAAWPATPGGRAPPRCAGGPQPRGADPGGALQRADVRDAALPGQPGVRQARGGGCPAGQLGRTVAPDVRHALQHRLAPRSCTGSTALPPSPHPTQVQGLLGGIRHFAGALTPGSFGEAAADAAHSCTHVVAFLQLAVGGVLPTALYLWSEGRCALESAKGGRQHSSQVGGAVRGVCCMHVRQLAPAGSAWAPDLGQGAPPFGLAWHMRMASSSSPPSAGRSLHTEPLSPAAGVPACRLGAAHPRLGWQQAGEGKACAMLSCWGWLGLLCHASATAADGAEPRSRCACPRTATAGG